MPDVFVVNRVAFGLAHFLENDLLGQLRGDAAQNSFGHLRDQQLAASFRARIQLARLLHRNLEIRVFDLLRTLNNGFHRIGIDLAALFVENCAEIFLRLVILPRRHDDRVLDRADHNLRVDSLFPAHALDDVVKLASHKKSRFQCFKVSEFQGQSVAIPPLPPILSSLKP